MSAEVHAAIIAKRGRIVASFELDEFGLTVGRAGVKRGAHGQQRQRHCGICGAADHDAKRCNGAGQTPKPLATRHRKAVMVVERIDPKPCSRCGATDHDARKHNTGRRVVPEAP